jgi:chromosome partitioning protein
MAVIAVYSLKGGVGKTTFAVNLAWSSAVQTGHPTLLWDLDPQWAASYLLGHQPAAKGTAHSLFEKGVAVEKLLLSTGMDNFDLLPSDRSLRALDRTFFTLGKKKRLANLSASLLDGYRRIILDCPPGVTETSEQMMRAADLIIVPVIPSPLSQRAMEEVVANLHDKHGGHVPILPVFSMVDRRRALHLAALDAEPNWPIIPMASAVEQMAARRVPLGRFAPRSPAADAFAALWKGIDRKLSRTSRKM